MDAARFEFLATKKQSFLAFYIIDTTDRLVLFIHVLELKFINNFMYIGMNRTSHECIKCVRNILHVDLLLLLAIMTCPKYITSRFIVTFNHYDHISNFKSVTKTL